MNTASMSLEEYPVVPERTKMLEKANNVFTIIFIVEMALKIIGLTPHLYFKAEICKLPTSIRSLPACTNDTGAVP